VKINKKDELLKNFVDFKKFVDWGNGLSQEKKTNWSFDKKPRPPLPRPPVFDSSGSVVLRTTGQLAEIGVHWCAAKISQFRMTCPDTTGEAGKCKCCASKSAPVSTRIATLAWDIKESRWCVYMAHPLVFREILEKCVAVGATPEMLSAGMGPDVILQRIGRKTVAEAIPETLGQPRGDGKSSLLDYMEGMTSMSLFRTCSSPAEVDAQYPDDPSPLEIGPKEASQPPQADNGPTGDELDGLRGDNRWDFM
jgi:hypothetical protein